MCYDVERDVLTPRRHLPDEGKSLERESGCGPEIRMRESDLAEAATGVGDRNKH